MFHKLKEIAGAENVCVNEPMSRHTTFRCGGMAAYFVTVKTEEILIRLLQLCREEKMPYFLVGNGSNLLVRDEGYDGIILKLEGEFERICRISDGCRLFAGSGAILAGLALEAEKHGLTGLEFAFGIPGSVGGAITMNAGAYGGEMQQVVKSVRVLREDLTIAEYRNEEMAFGYRNSRIKQEGGIVLSVILELKKGDAQQIRSTMEKLTLQRREKQPLEYPSAGSTFKRPEGYFAGRLIQDAGLKGYRVGGAMVSAKHAGFVINAGDATASDVIKLITDVREKVREQSGIELEPEVIIL